MTADAGVSFRGQMRVTSPYPGPPGTGNSPVPSVARIRGRVTGTRRPPRVTDPASLPCRTADRAGSCLPFGPHDASTSAFIIAAITCSPVPTASASRPSCQAERSRRQGFSRVSTEQPERASHSEERQGWTQQRPPSEDPSSWSSESGWDAVQPKVLTC
jgi:hypothetical protein